MPWKVDCVMSQRDDLCMQVRYGGRSVKDVAADFDVSRTTAHKWLRRWDEERHDGMVDRSRCPHHSPERTPAHIEQAICELRQQHRTWGPEKLRHVLLGRPLEGVPSERTVARILKRNGMIDPPAEAVEATTRFERSEPNELWQLDFKSRLYLPVKPRVRVFPMTIIDDHSRFNLCLQANENSQFVTVWPVLWDVMGHYGLPDAILTDNDSIFRGHQGGVTRLTGYLIRLGIRHLSGRAYHPQTQGKVERLHRTIQADVLNAAEYRSVEQLQAAFDEFRDVYNHQRPHQSLRLDVPGQHYRPSRRRRPDELPPVEYEKGAVLRRVWQNGAIRLRACRVHIGEGLAGEKVEIVDLGAVFEVRYAGHLIRTTEWDQLQPDRWA